MQVFLKLDRGYIKQSQLVNMGWLEASYGYWLYLDWVFFIWFTVNKENSATTAVASLNKFGNQTDTNSVAQESNKSATEKSKVAANTDFLAPVYGKQHLLMTFNDSVWVEIIDGSERQIINKRYKTGEKMSAYVQPPMRIFISNVNAVNMQYNQSEYDLAVHKQGAFAKFVLKRP